MAGRLGNFQTKMFSGWKSEVTKLNHVSTFYHSAPQKAPVGMVRLMATNFGESLESFLSMYPVKEFDSNDEYTWDVLGSSRRNVALLEARATLNGEALNKESVAGKDGAPFYLVFTEDWFFDGEVLHGSLNEVYPLRVLGDPIKEGTNTIYKVELINGSMKGMPTKWLQMGEKFSAEYAPVEKELSRKVGGIRHITPASMRNEWSTIRLYTKVSGALLDKKVAFGIPMVKEDASGKMVKDTAPMWMHYVEYEFEKTWQEAKNNILAYGVSNRNANGEYTNIGKSGEVIRLGDGLYAQMKRGNIHHYSKFSLKMIEEALIALCAGRLDFKDRTFVMRTGEFGAMEFSKAVDAIASGWTVFQKGNVSVDAVKKVASPLHSNALSAGYQYTEFLAPNNIILRLEVDKHYDDPVHNKIMHPNGGVAMSRRFDIFDIGTPEQANIFKCAIKGKPEYRGYQWGIRNPFTGSMDNPYMSYDEDSASIHRMTDTGICVLDPTRTMAFVPAILAE